MQEEKRAGVMLYFDLWAPVLRLGNKQVGRYARAALNYARWGRVPQDFASEVDNPLWLDIRASIDEQRRERADG